MAVVVQAYEEWVRANASWFVPALESLKSFTLFLPGRFDKNILTSEAIHSGLSVVSLYHDSVCDRQTNPIFDLKCGPDNSMVRRAKAILGTIGLVEVFIEMFAFAKLKQGSDPEQRKWFVVLAVETIKAYFKLRLLRNNNGRMITATSPEELMYNKEMKDLKAARADVELQFSLNPGPCPDVAEMYIKHDRTAQHPHGLFTTQPQAPPIHPNEAVTYRPPAREVASEVIYIARPVAYVAAIALSKAGTRQKSWGPVLVSLTFDLLSRLLTPKLSQLGPAQTAEYTRRTMAYFFYLARSPVFERFTKGPLLRFAALLAKIPLVGTFASSIIELLISLQVYYFYTAAS